jgi:hypothetical protein
MGIDRIQVKLFAREGSEAPTTALVSALHGWIQRGALDEILIDVADYSHVHEGPGVLLVAHAANYQIETRGGLGLRYARKRDGRGELRQRVADALSRALEAAALLEQEPALGGKLAFDETRLEVALCDRLAAPNDDATYASLAPEIAAGIEAALPGRVVTLARGGEARDPLTFTAALR